MPTIAPGNMDSGLLATIRELRLAGETVVTQMPAEEAAGDTPEGARRLVLVDGEWKIR